MKRESAMKIIHFAAGLFLTVSLATSGPHPVYGRIYVVTTFSDFASITKEIGGDKIDVDYLAEGDQDPHFVAPKPSLALKLHKADMFILTGMDLEVWASTLLDTARNEKVMDGAKGYITVKTGLEILEVPVGVVSRAQGDVHVSGNPHFHTSPVNWRIISKNIMTGLTRIDPANAKYYEERQKAFIDKVDRRLFGDDLVNLIGGEQLTGLLASGTLFTFLEKEYQGQKLSVRLGGWLKEALPFRGIKVMAYHKNWAYFARDFGMSIVGFIEPKPGIPPTPQYVQTCIKMIEDQNIKLMLVASYFEKRSPTTIAQRTGIKAIFLPLSVNAIPEVPDNFALVDYWIKNINTAFISTSAAGSAQ
jgi:ABC-type Zn uptake system ZnuABC Zn-binding protein ZnuA